MRIVKPSQEVLSEAAEMMRKGGLVAFPTETVYGVGTNALNPTAVAKIFEVKKRSSFEPLIVHIADRADLDRLCVVNEMAKNLASRFWPGPLTLVLPKRPIVPEIVTAGLKTVAVRMPSHPISLELIRRAGVPLVVPSANLFGQLSPTTAEEVARQLGDRIDMIIDGGRCPLGIESTVLDLSSRPTVLRPGSLPVEEIEKAIGEVEVKPAESHYSLKIPVRIFRGEFPTGKKVGFLAFTPPRKKVPAARIEILSPSGDLREAATNFFSCIQRLERSGVDIIYAEPVPERELGRAIMDRLRKMEESR